MSDKTPLWTPEEYQALAKLASKLDSTFRQKSGKRIDWKRVATNFPEEWATLTRSGRLTKNISHMYSYHHGSKAIKRTKQSSSPATPAASTQTSHEPHSLNYCPECGYCLKPHNAAAKLAFCL